MLRMVSVASQRLYKLPKALNCALAQYTPSGNKRALAQYTPSGNKRALAQYTPSASGNKRALAQYTPSGNKRALAQYTPSGIKRRQASFQFPQEPDNIILPIVPRVPAGTLVIRIFAMILLEPAAVGLHFRI